MFIIKLKTVIYPIKNSIYDSTEIFKEKELKEIPGYKTDRKIISSALTFLGTNIITTFLCRGKGLQL